MNTNNTAGYSGTPLAKKLGIKAGSRVLPLGAPDDYVQLLNGLPEDVRFAGRVSPRVDIVHAFVTRKADLERCVTGLRERLRPDANT